MFVSDPHGDFTGAPSTVELPEPLVTLRGALAALGALDPSEFSVGQLRVAAVDLCAAASALEAARLGVIADLDTRAAWVGDGSRNAGGWLARHTNLDAPAGRRDARIARRLRDTPSTAAALAAGEVSAAAAALVADAAHADPVAFAKVEDTVVEAASSMSRKHLKVLLDRFRALVRTDEDLAAQLERQHNQRGLYISDTLDGMVVLDGTFDPVDGAEVAGLIRAMEQHLFHNDHENRDEAVPQRTAAQRRADAMLELLRAGGGAFARGHGGTRIPGCGTSTTVVIRAEHLLDPEALDFLEQLTAAMLSDTNEAVDAPGPFAHADASEALDCGDAAGPFAHADASEALDCGDAAGPLDHADVSRVDNAHVGTATPVDPGMATDVDSTFGSCTDEERAPAAPACEESAGARGDKRSSSGPIPRGLWLPPSSAGASSAGASSAGASSAGASASGASSCSEIANDHSDHSERDDAPYKCLKSRTKPPPFSEDLSAQLKRTQEPIVVNLNGRDVVVDRALLQYLTCDTTIRALVVGPHDTPLDLGRTRRTASPAQRTATGVRDKGCIFHGCDCPPHQCDAHHIEHWENGGKTDICNLCLLCRTHHRLIHMDGWGIRMDPDGLPTVTYRGVVLPRNVHPPNFGRAA